MYSYFSAVELMAAALQDSDELELSSDHLSVRRTKPLPSEDDSDDRTVYVKGPFASTMTLEDLQKYFAPYGIVNRIHMRKLPNREKTFKGSVFVEFKSKDSVNQIITSSESGSVLYDEKAVQKVERKHEYVERKRKDFLARQEARHKSTAESASKGTGDDDEKKEDSGAAFSSSYKFIKEITPGVIVCIKGLGSPASIDTLNTFCITLTGAKAKFIELLPNESIAYLRFEDASTASKTLELLLKKDDDAVRAAGSTDFQASLLKEEEEKEYWEKIWKGQEASLKAGISGSKRKFAHGKRGSKRARN
jgi:RNA binding motif/RNA recognition motif. (a.k.a. RRM, RBD, or RNP domain)